VGAALMAGPFLICFAGGCRGEIYNRDHCGACGELSHVRNPSWRLWLEGRRAPRRCRRCLQNATHDGWDFLYFRDGGPCPNCGREAWSPSQTRVWLLVAVAGSAAYDPPDSVAPPYEIAAAREALERWLGGVSEARQRAILRGLLFGERTPADLAAEMGMSAGDRAFEDLTRQALRLLPGGLLPADRDADEAEMEREEARP
jgi:hypothetical protein